MYMFSVCCIRCLHDDANNRIWIRSMHTSLRLCAPGLAKSHTRVDLDARRESHFARMERMRIVSYVVYVVYYVCERCWCMYVRDVGVCVVPFRRPRMWHSVCCAVAVAVLPRAPCGPFLLPTKRTRQFYMCVIQCLYLQIYAHLSVFCGSARLGDRLTRFWRRGSAFHMYGAACKCVWCVMCALNFTHNLIAPTRNSHSNRTFVLRSLSLCVCLAQIGFGGMLARCSRRDRNTS